MGLLTLAIALLLVSILIVTNLLIAALPTDIKTIDITDTKLYSVSNSTKREIAKNDSAVTIYLISTGGEKALSDEGFHLHTFLGNLAAVNKKILYTVVDPLKNTEFLSGYSFENEIGNLSVVVESDLRAYHIPFSDFFSYYLDQVGKVSETDAMYYYYYYGVTPYYCFDGEALLLSAISYVTNTELPVIYTLSGHSEGDVTGNSSAMLKTLNIAPVTLSLSTETAVPADCDLLIVNVPQTDITEAEAALLCKYLAQGGSILLTTSPEISRFPNLGSVTTYMSLHGTDGIVTDGDSQHYYNSSYPYYLIPQINKHQATNGVSSVLLPVAHSIVASPALPSGTTVTPLFSTSNSAYIVPLDATTPEKPEGAETAAYCVGAISENAEGGALIWIPCTNFFFDKANEMSASGNGTLLNTIVTWVCGESDSAPTAPVLPLVTQTLSVNKTTAGILSFMVTLVLPGAIVGFGIFHTLRRKKR